MSIAVQAEKRSLGLYIGLVKLLGFFSSRSMFACLVLISLSFIYLRVCVGFDCYLKKIKGIVRMRFLVRLLPHHCSTYLHVFINELTNEDLFLLTVCFDRDPIPTRVTTARAFLKLFCDKPWEA